MFLTGRVQVITAAAVAPGTSFPDRLWCPACGSGEYGKATVFWTAIFSTRWRPAFGLGED